MLIVEDQGAMRALLREFLQTAFPALSIAEAVDGRRAMELVRERRPRLVFMDVNLPDINGIELTRQITTLLPDTRVIIVSQMTGSVYLDRARAAGAFAYVSKDRIHAELLPLAARALEGIS